MPSTDLGTEDEWMSLPVEETIGDSQTNKMSDIDVFSKEGQSKIKENNELLGCRRNTVFYIE